MGLARIPITRTSVVPEMHVCDDLPAPTLIGNELTSEMKHVQDILLEGGEAAGVIATVCRGESVAVAKEPLYADLQICLLRKRFQERVYKCSKE